MSGDGPLVVRGAGVDRAVAVGLPWDAVAAPAVVVDGVEPALAALASGRVGPHRILVVRGEGPRCGRGADGLAALAPALAEVPRRPLGVVTDGQLPWLDGLPAVSAVEPEAGALAALADGDEVGLGPLGVDLRPTGLVDGHSAGDTTPALSSEVAVASTPSDRSDHEGASHAR